MMQPANAPGRDVAVPAVAASARGRGEPGGRGWRLGVWALAFLVAPAVLAQGTTEFKLVVNSANPVVSLSRKEAAALFLKKAKAWDHGDPAEPIDLPEGSAVREAFSLSVLNKTVTRVNAYWQVKIFSGKGVPPQQLTSEREVLEFVKARRGAIGYVAASAAMVEGVKVIDLVE